MISTVERVLFLKSVDLFSRLSGEELAQVATIAQEAQFEQGALIIQEGEEGDSMYLVVEGEVMVHKRGSALSRLGEREAFGEMALLDSEPRSASVTAARDTLCLKIGREDFFEIMSEKVEIAYGIINVLTQRLREADKRISDLSADGVGSTPPRKASAPE